MSDPVAVAIIAGIQAIVLALIAVLARRTSRIDKATKATRHQVENDHDTNFREDTDEKHNTVMRAINNLISDVGGIRSDIRMLGRRVHTLEELEITQPRDRD